MPLMRPARRNDAPHVAVLMDIAGHGIEADYWFGRADEDCSPLSAARRLILEDPSVPYHHSKVHILEVDGEVAGAVIGGLVTGSAVDGFPDYFQPLLELESLIPGFWSVVALALYPEFRGMGLARLLLEHAEQQALTQCAKGMSIVTENTNARAMALYRRCGFKDFETRSWRPYAMRAGPTHWVLLTKPLQATSGSTSSG